MKNKQGRTLFAKRAQSKMLFTPTSRVGTVSAVSTDIAISWGAIQRASRGRANLFIRL